ncbi:hypothetical protein JCM8097_000139 [Rhodosporidiobolus ruineniae]
MVPVDPSQLSLRRVETAPYQADGDDEEDYEEDYEDEDDRYFQTIVWEILLGGRVVGSIKLWDVDLCAISEEGQSFFMVMDEHSGEASDFAATVFNDVDGIKERFSREGTGAWGRGEDSQYLGTLVYLEEIRIKPGFRGRGIGGWALEQIWSGVIRDWDLVTMLYLFAYPSSLNGEFPDPPPFQEDPYYEEKVATTARVTNFFRRADFRRIGTTPYFCRAMDDSHPSRSIPADKDADQYTAPGEALNPGDVKLFETISRARRSMGL